MSLQKMPLKKQLSYLFAAATGQGVMCSKVFQKDHIVDVGAEFDPDVIAGTMLRSTYAWVEAKPAPLDKERFIVKVCSYARNGETGVSGDRTYEEQKAQFTKPRENPYFTKEEVLAYMRDVEVSWAGSGYSSLDNPPVAARVVLATPFKKQL